MTTITVELPDQLAKELEQMIEAGWFSDPREAVLVAIREFVRRNHLALIERFQLEDIAWALTQKEKTP